MQSIWNTVWHLLSDELILPALIDNQQHLLERRLWSLHPMQNPRATASNQHSDEKPVFAVSPYPLSQHTCGLPVFPVHDFIAGPWVGGRGRHPLPAK